MQNFRTTDLTQAALSFLLFAGVVWGQEAQPVVVARVEVAEVKSGQRVIGTVNPLRRSTIGSAVDGRVKEFLVNEGDRVLKGQTLAQLRTETLQIEMAGVEAELELAKQRLKEYANGSRPEDVAEAEANMMAAKANFENANRRFQRIKSLQSANAVSATELEEAQQSFDAARYAVTASDALYTRIKKGARVELIAQAEAQVELQQQRLNLIQDRITKFKIVAPFDGFVAAEFTEIGAWISQGDPIVELIQLDEVEIEAPVTAEIAVGLRKGEVIRVEFPELPAELLTGKIDRVTPIADSRARTFPVHIRLQNKIENDTPLLLAGMLARIDFPTGRQQSLPLVPKDALVLNGAQRSVFVIDSANNEEFSKVREVKVELGVATGDRIQVRGELKDGDRVVVVGNERLTDGMAIKVIQDDETGSS